VSRVRLSFVSVYTTPGQVTIAFTPIAGGNQIHHHRNFIQLKLHCRDLNGTPVRARLRKKKRVVIEHAPEAVQDALNRVPDSKHTQHAAVSTPQGSCCFEYFIVVGGLHGKLQAIRIMNDTTMNRQYSLQSHFHSNIDGFTPTAHFPLCRS
jgi:hypothetical protein